MRALYMRLLRLYPYDYFREYGGEMGSVFCQAHQEARQRGYGMRAAFCFRELSGVLIGALRARFGYHSWHSVGRFDMRSEFRFPRSAIFLMLVILGTIFFAIEKAKTVYMNQPVDSIAIPNFLGLFGIFVILFTPLCVVAAAGYAILFLLRRSGVHRFSNVQTWSPRR